MSLDFGDRCRHTHLEFNRLCACRRLHSSSAAPYRDFFERQRDPRLPQLQLDCLCRRQSRRASGRNARARPRSCDGRRRRWTKSSACSCWRRTRCDALLEGERHAHFAQFQIDGFLFRWSGGSAPDSFAATSCRSAANSSTASFSTTNLIATAALLLALLLLEGKKSPSARSQRTAAHSAEVAHDWGLRRKCSSGRFIDLESTRGRVQCDVVAGACCARG